MGAQTSSSTNGNPTNPLDKALGIASIASAAVPVIGSFIQYGKNQRIQRQAEEDAAKAMDQARKALEVNYYDKLAIQKEPYELQREAMLSAGAQAMQAGVESERGAAAMAGRVLMEQNAAQGENRGAMGKELTDLEKLSAMEDSRLRDVGVQLDLEEVAGQQQIGADAAKFKNAAAQQAMQGIQNTVQEGIKAANLYSKRGGNNEDVAASAAAGVTSASPATAQRGTVPTSKLSSFQTMPSAKNMYEDYMTDNASYQGGSKFGSPIKMPSITDMYNYFNPIR